MAVLSLPQIVGVPPSAECAVCGGECCKRMPGEYHPDDVDASVDGILAMLRTGTVAVDWWNGDPRDHTKFAVQEADRVDTAYFLRPRAINHQNPDDPRDWSWGGQCVHLTPNGCRLTLAERPRGCRELVPDFDMEKREERCTRPIPDHGIESIKHEYAIRWLPHQAAIDAALSRFLQEST